MSYKNLLGFLCRYIPCDCSSFHKRDIYVAFVLYQPPQQLRPLLSPVETVEVSSFSSSVTCTGENT